MLEKPDFLDLAYTIKEGMRGFSSATMRGVSACGSFIGRQIENANEAHTKAVEAAKAQQAAIERQAVYQQAAMNYEAIAVEISAALATVSAKIGIDTPQNPVDIYVTVNGPISTLAGPYNYQVGRDKASIVAKNQNNLYRCSAQLASKVLQTVLDHRFGSSQSAIPHCLKAQVLDTADGLMFKIRVWIL